MPTTRALVDRLVARDLLRRHERIRRRTPPLTPRSPSCATVTVADADQGTTVVSETRHKVLILGGGATSDSAPLDDPAYEVWCCNDLAAYARDAAGLFRADRWFELHPRDPVVEWRRRPDFWDWLATMPVPVYQVGRRDAPQSLEFPIDRVIAAGRDYFGCTFAYQIGLALAEGFTTIALYGCDLVTAREATVERATVEWWTGFAEGKGVTIEWPATEHPAIRAGHHPFRYGGDAEECERERRLVYDWIRDSYQPTIATFLCGNRPPETIREWLAWRR